MLNDFTPENALETAIVEARQGSRTMTSLLSALSGSDVYISSKTEVLADGSGFEPLLLAKDGMMLVAVFSAPDRPALHREAASYVLQMNGRELFLRMPPDYGIILNPGFIVQLVITSDVIASIRHEKRAK